MTEAHQESTDGLESNRNNESFLTVTEPNLDQMDDLDNFLAEQVEDGLEVAPEEMSASPIQYSSWEIYNNQSEFVFPLERDFQPYDSEKLSLLGKKLPPEEVERLLDSIERIVDPNEPLVDEEGTSLTYFVREDLYKLILAPPLNSNDLMRLKQLGDQLLSHNEGSERRESPATASALAVVLMKGLIDQKKELNYPFKTLEDFEEYLSALDEESLYFFFRTAYGNLLDKDPQMRALSIDLARHMALEGHQVYPRFRRSSIAFLEIHPSQENIQVLFQVATKDSEPEVRNKAIAALASQPALIDSSGVDKVNSFLIELLNQNISADLKDEVIIVLSQRPGKEATEALLDYFDKNAQNENMQYYAFACLSRREGRAVERKLLDYLEVKIQKNDIENMSIFLNMIRIHAEVDDADNLWLKNEIHTLHKKAVKQGSSPRMVEVLENCLKKWPTLGSLESKLIRMIEEDALPRIRTSLKGLQEFSTHRTDQFYNLPDEAHSQWNDHDFQLEAVLGNIDNVLRYLQMHGKTPWTIASLKHLKEKVGQDPILKDLEKTLSLTPPQGIRKQDSPRLEWLFSKYGKGGVGGRIQTVLDGWGVGQVKMDRMIPNLRSI